MNSEDLFLIISLYTLVPRKLIKNKKNLPEILWGQLYFLFLLDLHLTHPLLPTIPSFLTQSYLSVNYTPVSLLKAHVPSQHLRCLQVFLIVDVGRGDVDRDQSLRHPLLHPDHGGAARHPAHGFFLKQEPEGHAVGKQPQKLLHCLQPQEVALWWNPVTSDNSTTTAVTCLALPCLEPLLKTRLHAGHIIIVTSCSSSQQPHEASPHFWQ